MAFEDYPTPKAGDIDFCIIGSGSTGNAVRIGNIMFDCGVAFSKMREELYKVDSLLITHLHSDHIKPQTFNSILSEFPRIKTFANATVAYKFHINQAISEAPFKTPSGVLVTPYHGRHDTEVTYYSFVLDGQNVLYATDTNLLENPNHIPFDWLFIESNYDEQKLREIGKQYARRGYDPVEQSLRHLSTQQSKAFYYLNRRDESSHWIELHKSRRFY